jgi:hypothetical protein
MAVEEQRSEFSGKGELTLPEGRPIYFIDLPKIQQGFGVSSQPKTTLRPLHYASIYGHG